MDIIIITVAIFALVVGTVAVWVAVVCCILLVMRFNAWASRVARNIGHRTHTW